MANLWLIIVISLFSSVATKQLLKHEVYLALDFKLKELSNSNTCHRIRENIPLLKMKK